MWQNDGSTQPIHTVPCTEGVSHLTLAPDQPLVLTAYGPYLRSDFGEGEGSHLHQLDLLDLRKKVRCHPIPHCVLWGQVGMDDELFSVSGCLARDSIKYSIEMQNKGKKEREEVALDILFNLSFQ